MDVAIMPIGAYQGYESLHCTPEQALQMATAMHAKYIVPMHCLTFPQSNEPASEPILRLVRAVSQYSSQLSMLTIGETFSMVDELVLTQHRTLTKH